MAALTLPSADEAPSSSFGLLDEDDYVARIESMSEVKRDSQFAKRDENGDPLPTVDIYLKPVRFADAEDAELVDKDGDPVHPEKHLVFFFDPHRLGVRPQVSRSRKFLASVLGVSPESRIELPGGLTDLMGKEVIVTVGIKNGKNIITDTRPIKRRARVRTAAPAPVVETTPLDTEDDVDEF